MAGPARFGFLFRPFEGTGGRVIWIDADYAVSYFRFFKVV